MPSPKYGAYRTTWYQWRQDCLDGHVGGVEKYLISIVVFKIDFQFLLLFCLFVCLLCLLVGFLSYQSLVDGRGKSEGR